MDTEKKKNPNTHSYHQAIGPGVGEASKQDRRPAPGEPDPGVILNKKVREEMLKLRKCTMEELEIGLAAAGELQKNKTIRIQAVYRMVLKGLPRADIEEFIVNEWDLTKDSAKRYYNEALVMIKEVAEETQKDAMEWHLATRKLLLSMFHEKEDLGGALNVLKDMAKLQALYAQDKASLAKAGLDESQAAREKETLAKLGNFLSQVYGNGVLAEDEEESEQGEEEVPSDEETL
jgi:hypothetical protein